MTITQPSSTSYKQIFSAQGVVDSNGNCVIELPSPPAGSIYTGTATIYDSPLGTKWMVRQNGLVIDTVLGANSVGGLQLQLNELVQITTSNLLAGTGTVFHATFVAIVSLETDTNLELPGHDSIPGSLITAIDSQPNTIVDTSNPSSIISSFTNGIVVFQVAPSVASIKIAVTVTGTFTGPSYALQRVTCFSGPPNIPALFQDTGYLFGYVASGAGQPFNVVNPLFFNIYGNTPQLVFQGGAFPGVGRVTIIGLGSSAEAAVPQDLDRYWKTIGFRTATPTPLEETIGTAIVPAAGVNTTLIPNPPASGLFLDLSSISINNTGAVQANLTLFGNNTNNPYVGTLVYGNSANSPLGIDSFPVHDLTEGLYVVSGVAGMHITATYAYRFWLDLLGH